MECVNKNKNIKRCGCSYPSCPRKGICCECVGYHLSKEEVPGCFFPPQAEKTYDRSVGYFISVCKNK
ncbi:MAG: hypothetical protein JSV34_06440 [Candidatus Omnitrophota bacterium]|nr:MAG: hypothetical protein JSV34_06440 [Candidatus Omnitrophota bacterium]